MYRRVVILPLNETLTVKFLLFCCSFLVANLQLEGEYPLLLFFLSKVNPGAYPLLSAQEKNVVLSKRQSSQTEIPRPPYRK